MVAQSYFVRLVVSFAPRYLTMREPTPGFMSSNGTLLSPYIVNAWLRSILKAAVSREIVLAPAFGLVLLLPPDQVMKILGRWSSDCYLRYIRTAT